MSAYLYTIVETPQQEDDASPAAPSRSFTVASTPTLSLQTSVATSSQLSPRHDTCTPASPCEVTLAKRTMQMFLDQELEIKQLHEYIDQSGRTPDAPRDILGAMLAHHHVGLQSLARQVEVRIHAIFAGCYTLRGTPRSWDTSTTLFANRIHAQFKPLIHAVDTIQRSGQSRCLEVAFYLGLEIAKFGFKIAVTCSDSGDDESRDECVYAQWMNAGMVDGLVEGVVRELRKNEGAWRFEAEMDMLGRNEVCLPKEDGGGESEMVTWCPRTLRALQNWKIDGLSERENRHWRDVQWGREQKRRRSRSL